MVGGFGEWWRGWLRRISMGVWPHAPTSYRMAMMVLIGLRYGPDGCLKDANYWN